MDLRSTVVIATLIIVCCNSGCGHDHSDDDHGHSHAHGEDAHGSHEQEHGHDDESDAHAHDDGHDTHAHGEDAGHGAEAAPMIETTIWTDHHEFFVEYPAFIVGQSTGLFIHITRLDGHQALKEGSVTTSLIRDVRDIHNTARSPVSPGIFKTVLQPEEAGTYQLIIDLNGSGSSSGSSADRIVLPQVEVYASARDAEVALSAAKQKEEAIAFSKEQAWRIDFQTAPVVEGEVFDVIPTSGVWRVAPSDFKSIVATTNGRVTFAQKNLTEGSRVRKGQTLMTVSSAGMTRDNQGTEIQLAKTEVDKVKLEYDRNKLLLEEGVIAKAVFEPIEQEYLAAQAIYQNLSADYAEGGKKVIVPFDGYLHSLAIHNGDFVEQGADLAMITSRQASLLETQLSSTYVAQLNSIHDVRYKVKPGAEWSSLTKTGGKVLSIGREVDMAKPLLSVFADVKEVVQMPEGSFTDVQLIVGEGRTATLVPESALMESYGAFTVIVQLAGERFERRPVKIGQRNGNEVEIISGLTTGEVVVTTGAYQVKMASMSDQAPAHGHAH